MTEPKRLTPDDINDLEYNGGYGTEVADVERLIAEIRASWGDQAAFRLSEIGLRKKMKKLRQQRDELAKLLVGLVGTDEEYGAVHTQGFMEDGTEPLVDAARTALKKLEE